jgi:hypothetical protein
MVKSGEFYLVFVHRDEQANQVRVLAIHETLDSPRCFDITLTRTPTNF